MTAENLTCIFTFFGMNYNDISVEELSLDQPLKTPGGKFSASEWKPNFVGSRSETSTASGCQHDGCATCRAAGEFH
jgi:hypothetical protein